MTGATNATAPDYNAMAQAYAAQYIAAGAANAAMPEEIVEALCLAQENVERATPDAEAPDGYRYTRADTLVRIAREALASVSLYLHLGGVRYESLPDGLGVAVVRDAVLRLRATTDRPSRVHVFRDAIRFPIDNSKRLANDKATGAAMTVSLAYFVRELLLIERLMAGDEIEQRADSQPREEKPVRRGVDAKPSSLRKRDLRAASDLAAASCPPVAIELGDEQREKEAAEDVEARKIDAISAQDEPQPDPAWLDDDQPTGQGAGEAPASQCSQPADPVHTGSTSDPVPTTLPAGDDAHEPRGSRAAPESPSGDTSGQPAGGASSHVLASGGAPPPPPSPPLAGAPNTHRIIKATPEAADEVSALNPQAVVEIVERPPYLEPPPAPCWDCDKDPCECPSTVEPPNVVDTDSADVLVIPGSRRAENLSLIQYVDSWEGTRESKARAKKSGPVSCHACKQPINGKELQRERGEERLHVSCLISAKAGKDPRKSKGAA